MAFTYFFRDMQTLEAIAKLVVPELRTRTYIRVWDAGCAMGPEPYSLAIMLRENMGEMIFRNVKIYATDIDESNLFGNIIANGIYPKQQVERIPKEIFTKYFTNDKTPGHFRIADELRKCVLFSKHDLLTLKPIRNEFGLIVCKNVLLHFKEQERVEVIRMFHEALVDGGVFVTEQTQKLPEELTDMFEPMVSNAQVFRKVVCKASELPYNCCQH